MSSPLENIYATIRGVTFTPAGAAQIKGLIDSRTSRSVNVPPAATASEISDALKTLGEPKPGHREALDAVYAAIVRTADSTGHAREFGYGDELTGLAAILHELKQP